MINGIHNHGNHYKVADTEGAYGEYYGEWMNGMANGQGTVKYASGNVYSGALKDGKRHGQGIYEDTKGNKYRGEWKNDLMHGEGTVKYASGNVYSGALKV